MSGKKLIFCKKQKCAFEVSGKKNLKKGSLTSKLNENISSGRIKKLDEY